VVNPQTVNERRSDRRVSTSRRGVIKFGPIDDVGSKHCRVVWSDGKRIGVSFE
jgi:hypothetical protein